MPAHIFSSRQRILTDLHDPALLSRGWLETTGLARPQALTSRGKGYQLALVTTNLLPSHRALCLGAVAGWRLLHSYLLWLATKEIINEWQAGPNSGGVFVMETLSSGTSAVKPHPTNPRHRKGHFLNLKGKHKSLMMSSGGFLLVSGSLKAIS